MAILVRPVREQLEHDRLIRHLQGKYERRADIALNVGDEQVAPVKIGGQTFFPDLVLTTDRKLAGLIEVETGESVHKLEAMYQWVPFAKARVPFHLYVPVPNYDAARRFCEEHGAKVSEIWTYRPAMEGFDLVRMYQDPNAASLPPASASRPASKPAAAAPAKPPVAAPKAEKPAPAPAPAAARASKPASKPVKVAKAAKGPKPPSRPAARPAAKPAAKSAAKTAAKPAPKKAAKAAKPARTAVRGKAKGAASGKKKR